MERERLLTNRIAPLGNPPSGASLNIPDAGLTDDKRRNYPTVAFGNRLSVACRSGNFAR